MLCKDLVSGYLLELRIPPVMQMIVIAAVMWVLSFVFPALNTPANGAIGLAASFVSIGVVIVVLGMLWPFASCWGDSWCIRGKKSRDLGGLVVIFVGSSVLYERLI